MTRTSIVRTRVLMAIFFLSGCDAYRSSWTNSPRHAEAAIVKPSVQKTPLPVSNVPLTSAAIDPRLTNATPQPVSVPSPVASRGADAANYGEIRGLIRSSLGRQLTIVPLVATTKKLPEVGSEGEIWVNIGAKEDNYARLARARVVSTVGPGKNLVLDLMNEEEVGPNSIVLQKLSPDRSLRFEYRW